ncbi:MAG: flagellin, partial [Planctomycetota bacterium]
MIPQGGFSGWTPGYNAPAARGLAAFGSAQSQFGTASERLATGLRINRGADDPAGLISSEKLGQQLAALEAETRSLERQRSFVDVADAAIGEAASLTAEANALAVANANTGGMSDAERRANQVNLDSLTQAIDGVFQRATFAGERVFSGEQRLRVGGAELGVDAVTLSSLGSADIDGQSLTLRDTGDGKVASIAGGDTGRAQALIEAASDQLATMRGELGAFSRNVISPALETVRAESENTAAARSVIRDADFAVESARRNRASLLSSSALATVAQSTAGRSAAINAV